MKKPYCVIAARYGSQCRDCGDWIQKYSLIRWKLGERPVHLDCEGEQKFVIWRTGKKLWARPLDKQSVEQLTKRFVEIAAEQSKAEHVEPEKSSPAQGKITPEEADELYNEWKPSIERVQKFVEERDITMEQFVSIVFGSRCDP